MAYVQALQSAVTSPILIQVGPGMLWTNVTKPADTATLLVSGNASGAQDQRVYGPVPFTVSGTFAGSTIGPSSIAYKPVFVDVKIETSTATVEKVLNTEDARCNFSLSELTSENVQATTPGGVLSGVATLKTVDADPLMSTGGSPQFRHTITIGGLRLVNPQCIAFISPNRRISAGSSIFSYVMCGYNAVSVDGFDAPFERGKETVWKVALELIADTSRTIGDQLMQLTVRQSS